MYAIIQTGGKQYKVQVGDFVEIEKLDAEVGAKVVFDTVFAVGEEGGKLNVGTPTVANANVEAEIADQFRGKKIVLRAGDKVLLEKKTVKLAPGEMETVLLSSELISSCESGSVITFEITEVR